MKQERRNPEKWDLGADGWDAREDVEVEKEAAIEAEEMILLLWYCWVISQKGSNTRKKREVGSDGLEAYGCLGTCVGWNR